jgi:hypothetical protein
MENHGGMIFAVGKLLISPPSAWQFYPQQNDLVAKQEKLGKVNMNLAVRSCFVDTLKGFVTCDRKILRHRADGFTSPPKEGVLQIFITLNNPSPSAGIEPANIRSSGGTLAITPPSTSPVELLTCLNID